MKRQIKRLRPCALLLLAAPTLLAMGCTTRSMPEGTGVQVPAAAESSPHAGGAPGSGKAPAPAFAEEPAEMVPGVEVSAQPLHWESTPDAPELPDPPEVRALRTTPPDPGLPAAKVPDPAEIDGAHVPDPAELDQ